MSWTMAESEHTINKWYISSECYTRQSSYMLTTLVFACFVVFFLEFCHQLFISHVLMCACRILTPLPWDKILKIYSHMWNTWVHLPEIDVTALGRSISGYTAT